MDVQHFNLTKRMFEMLNDLTMINPKDEKKRKAWEAGLFVFSESFAKQIIDEFNEL